MVGTKAFTGREGERYSRQKECYLCKQRDVGELGMLG